MRQKTMEQNIEEMVGRLIENGIDISEYEVVVPTRSMLVHEMTGELCNVYHSFCGVEIPLRVDPRMPINTVYLAKKDGAMKNELPN